ncbi:MAG: hypothetical protein IJC76_10235 [Lachnospiraceae bacterium]|nr:hypothetical protein [Lachnospiraceae bacterium]
MNFSFTGASSIIRAKAWVSNKYIFTCNPISIKVIDLSDIVWAYYYKTHGRYKQGCVRIYNTDKKMICINASENKAFGILEYWEENVPHILVAYSKGLARIFHDDFNVFLKIHYLKPVEEPDDFFDNV